VVAVRIVPAKIAHARLGQPEVSAHRGRGDGHVVSADHWPPNSEP
jgi:hypothetical protein